MKKQLMWILMLVHGSGIIFGQVDQQWLVSNNMGKDGVTTSNQNNFNQVLPSSLITIDGIRHGTDAGHRNDIFVIYTDGKHFNSRYSSGSGFFFPAPNPPATPTTPTKNNFKADQSRTINYLYLTNTYEGDEPPNSVIVSNGNLATNGPFIFTETVPTKILSANHNVRIGRDITLIVDYRALLNTPPVDTTNPKRVFTLKFDGLLRIQTGGVSYANVLDLSPVFNLGGTSNSPIYQANTWTIGGPEEITLNPYNGVATFDYINFRPTPNAATNYGPDANGARYKAVFTLYEAGVKVDELQEEILGSYDPNFLRVESICKESDGDYSILYHMQVQNTGMLSTSKVSIDVTFPAMFDLSCLKDITWKTGISNTPGALIISGQKCTFKFPLPAVLTASTVGQQPPGSIAYVKFRVRVAAGNQVELLNTSLEPTLVEVFFDGHSFDLHDFIDIVETYWKDEQFHQQRPISGGNCNYCGGGFNPGFILAGAALLAGAIYLVTRNR
ncbi:MAG: hypothetical protein ABIQ11_09400 [Saprospiraceae bacterium]